MFLRPLVLLLRTDVGRGTDLTCFPPAALAVSVKRTRRFLCYVHLNQQLLSLSENCLTIPTQSEAWRKARHVVDSHHFDVDQLVLLLPCSSSHLWHLKHYFFFFSFVCLIVALSLACWFSAGQRSPAVFEWSCYDATRPQSLLSQHYLCIHL